jgi:hypothetical protein
MSKYFNGSLFLITILILVNITPSESTDADENSVVEDRTTGALDFIVQTCTNYCNCQNLTTGLVVDNNWRGFHYNLCYDPKKCDKVIIKQLPLTSISLNIIYVSSDSHSQRVRKFIWIDRFSIENQPHLEIRVHSSRT